MEKKIYVLFFCERKYSIVPIDNEFIHEFQLLNILPDGAKGRKIINSEDDIRYSENETSLDRFSKNKSLENITNIVK